MLIDCVDSYSALIVRQPGTGTSQGHTPAAVGSIDEITSLEWGRLRSGVSSARIVFTRCPNNCALMETPVRPWAYELWIYRNNILVWCGPIVFKLLDRVSETFELNAWDITGWNSRRTIDVHYTNTDDATSIAANLVAEFFDGTFFHSNPAYEEYLVFLGLASSIVTVEYDAWQYQVADKWADMVTAGFNYTTMGRYTIIMGERAPNIAQPFILDASNITGNMQLVEDGTNFADRATALGEGALVSTGPFGAEAAYYGTVDWPSVKYQGITSTIQLGDLAQALVDEKRDPSPQLVIPSGASLASETMITQTGFSVTTSTPIALPDLVCGMRYDVQIGPDEFCASGTYPMLLEEVRGTWTPEAGEKIAVSLGRLHIPPEE